jgi:DNA-binding MarR family transcriptional regulator
MFTGGIATGGDAKNIVIRYDHRSGMARTHRFDYKTLAEFRYHIRKFVHFSEQATRAQGVNTQQHQLLLALKGLPDGTNPTVGALAERLQLRHHSAVGLVDRLAQAGYVSRRPNPDDRRQVLVRMTKRGDAVLQKLTRIHRAELLTAGPLLLATLRRLIR